MVELNELLQYLNQSLEVEKYSDYCPNGLHVQGKSSIKKLVTGVSACQKLFDFAVDARADAILVHHGFFWKGESQPIVGVKYNRMAALLKNNINLFAYHLPLDFHPSYGNNVQLAKVLKIKIDNVYNFSESTFKYIFYKGSLDVPVTEEEFSLIIEERLNRKPLLISCGSKKIQTIGWCSGGAQGFIWQAKQFNVDAYITGEASEQTTHLARELGIHFYVAGHHATERYGVKALGEHLAEKFQIDHEFIDIDNPI